MLKKILIGVGVLVGLIVAAGVATPFLIDPNAFKPQIVAKVKEATGRDLVIDGPLRLSMFPTPSVSAEGVRLSNAPGGKAAQMLDLKAASAGVALWPLLSKRVEISEVRLIEPKIAIEVAADGRANYEFTPAGAPPTAGAAQAPAASTGAKEGGGVAISAQRIVIVDGLLTYSDAKSGREARFEKVSMTLSVPSLAGPFAVDGALTANGVPLTLDGKLGVKAAQGVPLSLSVRTDAGEAKFTGAATDL
ncbi:MAG: AsmA family protein, partial [Rhodospirillales bacterium]|nr:AsmA family protein [Rhodospirillales bacterium]